MKCGLEFPQGLERSIGARTFVGAERECLRRRFDGSGLSFGKSSVAVGHGSNLHCDRKGFVFELSRGDGRKRFFVRIQRELVGLLARDTKFARNVLRAEAHADIRVGRMIDKPRIGRNLVAAHGHERHGLGTACDDDLRRAAANALGGKRDGLQAGGTEAVDGHRGSFHGQAGAERSDARHVHALLAFGHGTAENYVINFLGFETRNARKRFFDGQRGEIVGAGGAQRAFEGAAYRSAYGRNNYGFRHGGTSYKKAKLETRKWNIETQILRNALTR